jgi:hypothetical protein
MTSKITRRMLLGASLGAAQLAMLDRFGSLDPVRAETSTDAPTRLLVLYLQGGVRFYPAIIPFDDEWIRKTIPAPTSASGEPIFFRPEDVVTLDGDSGGFMPLRMGANWNPADPGDRTGYNYSPQGYSWLHYGLGPTTAAFHGVDMGSFAHSAAYVASMCGIAGEAYRSPAMISVVANYLHRRFATTRPIPCVAISGSGTPQAPGLPAHAAPAVVPNVGALAELFSSSAMRHRRWTNCDARTVADVPSFDGSSMFESVGLTNVDSLLFDQTRSLRARSSRGSDQILDQIYGSYAAISRTLANDVVTAVESMTPVTIEKPDHLRASGMFDFTFGLANGRIDMTASCEWILRLMKSNVTSAVYAFLPEMYYDSHNAASFPRACASVRAQLDMIARMMGEMKATPSPDRPGKTLYDDTIVIVHSEFNRSIPTGPNQDDYGAWNIGDDHNAISSLIVSGGTVLGNRQIGGFEMPSTLGLPVAIDDEGGRVMRTPNASDFVATICQQFGMVSGDDYFIPGGYGPIVGICP